MSKLVNRIIDDSRTESGKVSGENASEKFDAAKKMENIKDDKRSEYVKLIARAETAASAAVSKLYSGYVCMFVENELKKYADENQEVISVGPDGTKEYGLTHTAEKTISAVRDSLESGAKVTEFFTKIPTSTENGLEFKDVNDLHGAFMSLQRSPIAIKAERKREENERKARVAAEKAAQIERIQSGKMSMEDMQALLLRLIK